MEWGSTPKDSERLMVTVALVTPPHFGSLRPPNGGLRSRRVVPRLLSGKSSRPQSVRRESGLRKRCRGEIGLP